MGNLYYPVIEVTDFGPFVTKLVLAMPREVCPEEIGPEDFSVYVEIRRKDGSLVKLPESFVRRDRFLPSKGYRPVKAAYPSTLQGEPVTGGSRFVTLEMPYGPIWKCSSALAADFQNINGHESYTVHDYRVTLTKTIGAGESALDGLVFDRRAGSFNRDIAPFRHAVSTHPDLPIRYGYFVPDRLDGPKPLIIFLHGAGEGGQDLPIAYSGNKVTALTGSALQALFGGAFVLVPQCDTMWLDDGSGRYGDSGRSMYTEALKYLIDEFIEKNACVIDRSRLYIGGDSNGGFMTMRMLMSYPDVFAAGFPICEAMLDERVSEHDIQNLARIPLWFTHAKNDPVVKPEKYAVATYLRLKAAGAKNLHFTYWDKIEDMHGLFTDEQGKPYQYMAHFAWIPVLNDDCRLDFDGGPVICEGRAVTLMRWLALQRKP